ncbi:CDP-diacylglycerol--glycerol-3-phosphate 3-phosphatidyltransferase [Arcanobacterium wilhelmae]|uniref:Phosphatidylinositol phosphate synthase n=1 Tax=Arcanobacterium wilhelmae TaxID=1803177 RepID=A0ABT9N8P3_9ACTO|nr:CDP-alcohol phosphatidyltransferase family protein [Arcanobacterium wilhelmae]MDP9800072.1 CDP-diacylglycerol--glycerol-3-phosphate 3-phosphatidyltransferase [Arcanobacterium wilhelmae]WFN89567.1 CDP-alcohol phosphatidyltransferase family protein [Arcanobacterium wilhelmae]
MLSRSGRPLAQVIFGPFARAAVKLGISANTATLVGGIATSASALAFFTTNHLIWGIVVTTILVIFDNLDGQIARATGTASAWGAFLDSTMDRFADGAIFGSLAMWAYLHADAGARPWGIAGAIAAGLIGSIVPYARSRAEAIGKKADVGLAERADRLVAVGVTLILSLLFGHWLFVAGMWLIAAASLFTVGQRMMYVRSQILAEEAAGGKRGER